MFITWPAFTTRKQRQVWSHHKFWKTNAGLASHVRALLRSLCAWPRNELLATCLNERRRKQTHDARLQASLHATAGGPDFMSLGDTNSWTHTWKQTRVENQILSVCVTDGNHWSLVVRWSNVALSWCISKKNVHRRLDVMQNTFLIGVDKRMLTQAADVWKRANVFRSVYIQEC